MGNGAAELRVLDRQNNNTTRNRCGAQYAALDQTANEILKINCFGANWRPTIAEAEAAGFPYSTLKRVRFRRCCGRPEKSSKIAASNRVRPMQPSAHHLQVTRRQIGEAVQGNGECLLSPIHS
jgi:hypothetical protein